MKDKRKILKATRGKKKKKKATRGWGGGNHIQGDPTEINSRLIISKNAGQKAMG